MPNIYKFIFYVGVAVGEFKTQNCFEKDPKGIRNCNGYSQG